MRYNGVVEVPKDLMNYIDRLLLIEPACEDECFGEDNVISESYTFSNGMVMDVKVCGVKYEEGRSNTAWTQAILYAPAGDGTLTEVDCTEVCDEFKGPWWMNYNGDEYCVAILMEKGVDELAG